MKRFASPVIFKGYEINRWQLMPAEAKCSSVSRALS